MYVYVQQELGTKGHRSMDVGMTKGPKDYHLALVKIDQMQLLKALKRTKQNQNRSPC